MTKMAMMVVEKCSCRGEIMRAAIAEEGLIKFVYSLLWFIKVKASPRKDLMIEIVQRKTKLSGPQKLSM